MSEVICDLCSKSGKLGNTIMRKRVEGDGINVCRKCEDMLDQHKPKPTRSLIDRMRSRK